MRIGVPKEIKVHEYRVGLTPGSVREFVGRGHEVVVETTAGSGIGASDKDYRAAGATIGSVEDAFAAEMVVKVKEPQPLEWSRLREGQILFTYLHLASDQPQTDGLLASGVSAIAYETITDAAGGLPLLSPMSEVAGRLSIQAAASSLERHSGGEGLLLGGVPGVPPGRVVVLGGGVVGTQAAKVAVGIGAEVTILDTSLRRLRELDDLFGGRVRTRYSNADALEEEAARADALIGAVLVPGASAPRLVTRQLLRKMKPGSVFVDVAIDQGGCSETSRATTHAEPTYVEEGVVHYCVANMPGAVPRTSTAALNNATMPIGLALADRGLGALENPHIAAGLNVHLGLLTNRPVAASLGMEWSAFSPTSAA
ncbi:alanine dehydrogenase [Altererythrobacter sp. Root672]|uniref:alanine dehydrogenase n=1 Tax=Altererythrobacter sp. Root672 TaxID=1736584 RepID=UPI0006F278DC|nr:alanine dehydrogenase [Altererythrobacter sp. Root672]KRA84209.1 alanine dehydrogenase [Altererythrobacter sp. Root672]